MSVARSTGYRLASVLKGISILLFAFTGGALIALVVYDLVEFEPRRTEIRNMLDSVSPLERSPPPMLSKLQRADARGMEALLATRVILLQLDRDAPAMRTLTRIRREFLWLQLVKVHLSESEQMLVYRSRAFMGQRSHGFEAGALSVFARPLDRLSNQELAELVVLPHWPYRYRRPEYSADRAKAASALLDRVRTAR